MGGARRRRNRPLAKQALPGGGTSEIAPCYWLPQLTLSIGYAERRWVLKVSRPTIGCARRGLRRFCVVIRRRVEDTGKMAAVAGLVRGPLRQVGSGPWSAHRRPCALSETFSLSLPGFWAAEEAFSPLGARSGAVDSS